MNRIKSIIGIFVFILILPSCGNSDKIDDKLLTTYKEILVARETIQDSTLAAKEVGKIMAKHGFTEPEFRKELMEAAKNKKAFLQMLDSIRNDFQRDLNKKH